MLNTKIRADYRQYFKLVSRIWREILKAPAQISALFLLAGLLSVVQISFAILIAALLGGDGLSRLGKVLPIENSTLDLGALLPVDKLWIAILIFLALRLSMGHVSDRVQLTIRRRVETGLSDDFVTFMKAPPLTDTETERRENTLQYGPSVMTMGAKEAGLVGALMARSFVKIPFILLYLILLVGLFPHESIYGVIPLLAALLIMIGLVINMRKLSVAYTQSITPAIAERRQLWKHFPRDTEDTMAAVENTALANIKAGKTGVQFQRFYARHFRTIDINFIVSITLLLVVAASTYAFSLRAETGDAEWPEIIIMLAVMQLMMSDVGVVARMLSAFSRNFEPINRFLSPLLGLNLDARNARAVPQRDMAHYGDISDAVALSLTSATPAKGPLCIDAACRRINVLNLSVSPSDKSHSISAALRIWKPHHTERLSRSDYFPTPLPKDGTALIDLGQNFPKDALYINTARHIRPKHVDKWSVVFSHMPAVPILNVCLNHDQLLMSAALGFDYVLICKGHKVLDGFSLSDEDAIIRLKSWSTKSAPLFDNPDESD